MSTYNLLINHYCKRSLRSKYCIGLYNTKKIFNVDTNFFSRYTHLLYSYEMEDQSLIKNEFIYSYILFSIHILKIFTAASKNKVFSF